MKHVMSISVTKHPINSGVVACRVISVREKLLRLLLGTPQKLTIIVPGDTVDTIDVKETKNEEVAYETV